MTLTHRRKRISIRAYSLEPTFCASEALSAAGSVGTLKDETLTLFGGAQGLANTRQGADQEVAVVAQDCHRGLPIAAKGGRLNILAERGEARDEEVKIVHALVAVGKLKVVGHLRAVIRLDTVMIFCLRLHVKGYRAVDFLAVVVHLGSGLEVHEISMLVEPVARAGEVVVPEI